MKIVVLDGFTENPGDLSWDGLRSLGELTVYDRTPDEDEEILRRIGNAEAVYTNKTPLRAKVLEKAAHLKFIGVLATGYNVVDTEAADRMQIPIANIPSYGTEAVSQFAIALLLEICHHVGHHDREVKKGRWGESLDWCFWDYPMMELSGKTMGILGFGRIGQTTGRIAKALGMRILASDIQENEEGRTIGEYVPQEELFAKSDVIMLHCPLFPETREVVCWENIRRMKKGVILVNNSRGGLVREKDLAEALEEGWISAAAVDVVSTEPIQTDNPLLSVPNCLITPHISWAARESRQRLMDAAVRNLESFLEGKCENIVNLKGKG